MKVRYCPFCGLFPQHDGKMVDHHCTVLGVHIVAEIGVWNIRHAPTKPKPIFMAEQTEMKLPAQRSPKQEFNDRLLCALASAEIQEPVTTVIGADARRHAMALKVIRAYTPSVTPEMIASVADQYRIRWPNVDLTSNALAKWWTKLTQSRQPAPITKTAAQNKESVLGNIDRYFGITKK